GLLLSGLTIEDGVDLVVVTEEHAYLDTRLEFNCILCILADVVLGAVDADPLAAAVSALAGDLAGDDFVGDDGQQDGLRIIVVIISIIGAIISIIGASIADSLHRGNGVGIVAPLGTEVGQGIPDIGQVGLLAVHEDIGVIVNLHRHLPTTRNPN